MAPPHLHFRNGRTTEDKVPKSQEAETRLHVHHRFVFGDSTEQQNAKGEEVMYYVHGSAVVQARRVQRRLHEQRRNIAHLDKVLHICMPLKNEARVDVQNYCH